MSQRNYINSSYMILLGLLLTCFGCSENNSKVIEQSGVPELDQTAQFAYHLVKTVNKRQGMNSPSSIVNYITSTSGSAELWPPNPELEPDAAEYYKGPRPANGVGFSKGPQKQGIFDKEIIIRADDSKSLIIVEAYESDKTEPVFTWKWKFPLE